MGRYSKFKIKLGSGIKHALQILLGRGWRWIGSGFDRVAGALEELLETRG